MTVAERVGTIDRVLQNPPAVHVGEGAPDDVWATDRGCYELLATHCPPGSKTLETGCGVSTILFTAWGADHTCVVPSPAEADRCREYCAAHGIDSSRLSFTVKSSDVALPTLDRSDHDLLFIDGGHAFPLAIIDWYYGASRVKQSGVVVIDDVQLPSVRLGLLEFLDADPRWTSLAINQKWVAYRKEHAGPLSEHWVDQPFLTSSAAAQREPAKLRKLASAAKRLVAGPR